MYLVYGEYLWLQAHEHRGCSFHFGPPSVLPGGKSYDGPTQWPGASNTWTTGGLLG